MMCECVCVCVCVCVCLCVFVFVRALPLNGLVGVCMCMSMHLLRCGVVLAGGVHIGRVVRISLYHATGVCVCVLFGCMCLVWCMCCGWRFAGAWVALGNVGRHVHMHLRRCDVASLLVGCLLALLGVLFLAMSQGR